MNLVQTFSIALPEFILVAVALSMVLVAAFANSSESEGSTLKLVRSLSLGGYGLAFLSLFMLPAGQVVLFNGLFEFFVGFVFILTKIKTPKLNICIKAAHM